jgi:uncharacterized protein with PQ loop repeat
MNLETIGYIGSILLALCAFPQAIQSYMDGHSKGINLWFLLMWTFGEIFTIIYVIPLMSIPLFINYGANLMFLTVIWRYKIWQRN